MLKQCTILTAKTDFSMRKPGARGRPANVKAGDKFWVTSSMVANQTMVTIEREGKPMHTADYNIPSEMIQQLFNIEEY